MENEKFVDKTTTYCVNTAGGKVESLRVKEELTTVIRAYDGGNIGIAGRFGEGDDNLLLAEAVQKLALGVPYPCNLSSGLKREENAAKEIIPKTRFVKTVKGLFNRLNAAYSAFIFSGKVILKDVESVYENSLDTRFSYRGSNLEFALCIKSRESANIIDMVYSKECGNYSEDEIVSDIGVLLDNYNVKAELPAERVPVIISESVFSYALSELVAEKFASGASLFSGKQGGKIFSEKLNVRSDVNPSNPSANPFFDREGVVNEGDRFNFVKDGVLTGIITTKRSAAQFSLPLSGGAASDFDGVPQASVAGFGIDPTAESAKELVNGKLILVWETSGGDMTPDGNIGLPVQLAYLCEDGKIIGRLPEFSLNANLFELFGKDFIGAAKNTFFASPADRVIAGYFKININ